jgi:hypothetical protein
MRTHRGPHTHTHTGIHTHTFMHTCTPHTRKVSITHSDPCPRTEAQTSVGPCVPSHTRSCVPPPRRVHICPSVWEWADSDRAGVGEGGWGGGRWLPQLDVVVNARRGQDICGRVRYRHVHHVPVRLDQLLQRRCWEGNTISMHLKPWSRRHKGTCVYHPCSPAYSSTALRICAYVRMCGVRRRTGALVPHKEMTTVAAADHVITVGPHKVDALDRPLVAVA